MTETTQFTNFNVSDQSSQNRIGRKDRYLLHRKYVGLFHDFDASHLLITCRKCPMFIKAFFQLLCFSTFNL